MLALALHHISSAVSSQQIGHAPPDLEGLTVPSPAGQHVTHRHSTPSWLAAHPQTCPSMSTQQHHAEPCPLALPGELSLPGEWPASALKPLE